ncbi:MAG: hypothetical protein ACI835_002584 [Planctomycetota bacterium]|jgi:hypothetical protein
MSINLRINTCLALLLGLSGCLAPGYGSSGAIAPTPVHQQMNLLETSLRPLRDGFNAASDRARVIALVSPTCQTCAFGAQAIREVILDTYPDARLRVFVVWINVSREDNRDGALTSAACIDDPRVRHYHDPGQRAGRAFAEGLLPTGFAWDTYLFYSPGAVWDDLPPRPRSWASQLGRIAGDNFHPREKLALEFERAGADLLGPR